MLSIALPLTPGVAQTLGVVEVKIIGLPDFAGAEYVAGAVREATNCAHPPKQALSRGFTPL
jgi:hypothetical protein